MFFLFKQKMGLEYEYLVIYIYIHESPFLREIPLVPGDVRTRGVARATARTVWPSGPDRWCLWRVYLWTEK